MKERATPSKKLTALVERAEAARVTPLTSREIDEFASRIRPHFGKVHYEPPPSYRAVLNQFGPLDYPLDDDDAGFRLLTPREVVVDTRELVHVPKGVEWEDASGRACIISTNHLVAFAEWPLDHESRWCFDIEAQTRDGESPVYFHDQDEPMCAKDVKTGQWVNPTSQKPAYANFSAWLEAAVGAYEKKAKRRRR